MRVAACPKAKLQNECFLVFLGVSFQHGFERFTPLDGIGGLVGGSLSNLFVDESVHPTRKLDLRSNVIGSEGVVSLEGSDNAVPVEVNSSSTNIRG